NQGQPLAGVTVTLSGDASRTATTDANGSYSFPNLAAGDYTGTITGFPADVAFPETSQTVTREANTALAVSFNGSPATTASVSGQLFVDANANDLYESNIDTQLEVAGVTITLV